MSSTHANEIEITLTSEQLGDDAHIKEVLVDGFKVPVGDKEYSKSIYDIAHSEKLVLVDQKGFIRGYYKMEKNDINRLMIDLGLLANNAFKKKDS